VTVAQYPTAVLSRAKKGSKKGGKKGEQNELKWLITIYLSLNLSQWDMTVKKRLADAQTHLGERSLEQPGNTFPTTFTLSPVTPTMESRCAHWVAHRGKVEVQVPLMFRRRRWPKVGWSIAKCGNRLRRRRLPAPLHPRNFPPPRPPPRSPLHNPDSFIGNIIPSLKTNTRNLIGICTLYIMDKEYAPYKYLREITP
jgi:hypothetical protein